MTEDIQGFATAMYSRALEINQKEIADCIKELSERLADSERTSTARLGQMKKDADVLDRYEDCFDRLQEMTLERFLQAIELMSEIADHPVYGNLSGEEILDELFN
jgi:hypothetical protein